MSGTALREDEHPRQCAERVKAVGHALGFDLVGIAPAEPSSYRRELTEWLEAGRHASMRYMAAQLDQRTDIRRWFPGARSVVMVAVNYWNPTPAPSPGVARFAQYAVGADYHKWMRRRLARLGRALSEAVTTRVEWRPFVDTAPVLEREHAMRAGLGWIGKNAMLISHRIGSYLLLGGLATDMRLATDPPQRFHCGTCTRCLDACPTRAIIVPHVVDARRCTAYHTIESRAPIPGDVAAALRSRVFGCDICQEACPMNRPPGQSRAANLRAAHESAFHPRPSVIGRSLHELLRLSETDFASEFRGSAVRRAGAAGLRRTVKAVLKAQGAARAAQS